MANDHKKNKSRADLELNLSFVDRMETKIQSPDREVFSPTKEAVPGQEKSASKVGKGNDSIEDINGNTSHESVSTVAMETDTCNDKAEGNMESDPARESENTDSEKFIDRKESRLSCNSGDFVLRNTEILGSTIDITELSLPEKEQNDSLPLNTLGLRFAVNLERMPISVTDPDSVLSNQDTNGKKESMDYSASSERLEDENIAPKQSQYTYEIMSATSNILSYEKVYKDKDSDVTCSDVLSANTSQPSETQSENLEISQEPTSPQRFSKDSEQHVTIEEDEENVIIHLDSDFSQEDKEAEKSASSTEKISIKQGKEDSVQLDKSSATNFGSNNLPPVNMIEVERKFKVTADSKIRLLELGAELRTEKRFSDTYFDSLNYSLILSDCWLRQRNSAWELKVTTGNSLQQTLATGYTEITNEQEIVQYLVSHFHSSAALLSKSVLEVIEDLELEPFAEFSTIRQTYYLPECTIDLDLADFGFQVGEIEVMVTDNHRIASALSTIDEVADKLGVDSSHPVAGKITTYLFKKNLPLYHRLVDANILPSCIDDVDVT